MESVLFTKKEVFSEKLNKNVLLDMYEKDGLKIISTNSLLELLRNIRTEFSITTQKRFCNSYKDDGTPAHILCIYTLRDKDGYEEDSVGEYTFDIKDLSNEVSANFRGKIAERRAESEGIINYLRLPGKWFSSEEVNLKPSAEDVKNTLMELGKKETNDVGYTEAPIESAPTLSSELYEESVEEPDLKPTIDKKEEGNEISLETKIGFGPVKDLTIGEALKDPSAKKFLKLIESGAIHNPGGERGEILDFIKNELNNK